MRFLFLLLTAAVLFMVCGSPAEARIYRYVDKYGVVHFTNDPQEAEAGTDMDFQAVKLKEPRFEVRGAWDSSNDVTRTFRKIYDRLHKKRLLDEEELRQLAEQKKAEEEAMKKAAAEANGATGEASEVVAQAGEAKPDEAKTPAVEENIFIKPWWGMKVRDLSSMEAKKLNLDDNGIMVAEVYPESPASAAGIYAGQVIVELNVDNRAVVIRKTGDFSGITVSIDKSIQVVLMDPTSGMTLYKPLVIKNIPNKELANEWF